MKKDWLKMLAIGMTIVLFHSVYGGQPNVIIIITDDQGLGQLDFLDQESELPAQEVTERYSVDPERARLAAQTAMPHLSRLASGGVKLSNAYVASPVCSPSRAAIMTARYPQRFGIFSNDDAVAGVPLSEHFLAAQFQEAGYRTAMIGKWHLGKNTRRKMEMQTRDYHLNATVGVVPHHHPLVRGFDYYYGFNQSGASYYKSPSIFRDYDNVLPEGYLTDVLSEETVGFIHESKEQPFLVVLAYSAPHIPLHVPAPEKYLKRFDTGNRNVDNYYATLAAVDDGIGMIVECLENVGKLEDTLIFFISDNGAVIDSPLPMNGRLAGNKGTLMPGGVNVPFIVKFGNRFSPGSSRSQLVSAMDIFPTAMDAAGLEIPDELDLDGVSLLPVLDSDKPGPIAHEYLFWAGPHALHWSPENKDFWKDYYAYVSGKERELGDVPKSRHVEKYATFSIAATDGDTFIEWQKHDDSVPGNWVPVFHSEGSSCSEESGELLVQALGWMDSLD